MVLQPATIQNPFCGRPAAVTNSCGGGGGGGTLSLLPPQTPSGYSQGLLHSGFTDSGSFQTAAGGGQFANADDQQTVVGSVSSGFIEFVNAGGQIGALDDAAANARPIVSAG